MEHLVVTGKVLHIKCLQPNITMTAEMDAEMAANGIEYDEHYIEWKIRDIQSRFPNIIVAQTRVIDTRKLPKDRRTR